MAMQWIQENIEKFGGNPKQVTLLGHGTSGATNAMLHLTSTKEPKLFSKLIIMSGTIYSSYSYQSTGIDNSNTRLTKADDASKIIIKKMACESSNVKFTLDCLRQKSVNDLLKAFEQVYQVSIGIKHKMHWLFITIFLFFFSMAITLHYLVHKKTIIYRRQCNTLELIRN